jgi:hypothetical protein
MLEVELDIFSGMPNPRWLLSSAEEAELAEQVVADPGQLSAVVTADEQFSLGYRGLIVRRVKPDDGAWERVGAAVGDTLAGEYRVGARPASRSTAEWLLRTSEPSHKRSGVTDQLREVAAGGVALVESPSGADDPATFTAPARTDVPDPEVARFPLLDGEGADSPEATSAAVGSDLIGAPWYACPSNVFLANVDAFNRPENVTRNNCYCFASNHLAGVRYALPGRRGGSPATSITCAGVTAGLVVDGWKYTCQPNALTIALVIWPNVDYHFYRLVTGGPYWWWGHKPGGTPAKYTDDCGHSIYQYQGQGYAPNNICRGNYTDFCGYFYQNNNTAFVA